MATLIGSRSTEQATTGRRDTVAVEFTDVFRAHEAMLAAARLERRGSIELADTAVVTRDGRGRILINHGRRPAAAAAWAALWGWFLTYLFFGPLLGLAGALVAGGAAALWARREDGIATPLLREIGSRVAPGGAAGVFMVADAHFTHVLGEARRFRGRLLHSTLPTADEEVLAEALTADC